MPIEAQQPDMHRHRLIRRVVLVRGEMEFALEVQPRFDYGREEHEVEMHPHGVLFRAPSLTLALEGAIAKTMGSSGALRRVGPGVQATFTLEAGDAHSFVLERVPPDHICRPVSRARDRRRLRRHGGVLAALAGALALPRPLARDGAPLGADPEAPDVRADGRAGGRADHVAARADRRRAQLGLPLHLDPRRRLLPLRPPAPRLHGGGGRLHELAHRPHARLEGRRLWAAPDHVRHRRALRAARRSSTRAGRAIATPRRCASATPPPSSASSTSTAS